MVEMQYLQVELDYYTILEKLLTHEAPWRSCTFGGAEICKRYDECDTVINAIYAHHGHERTY